MPDPFANARSYAEFVHSLPERFPIIRRSTLTYIPSGAAFGRLEGLLLFPRDIVLCVQEFLNFELGIIEGYGYEVSRSASSTEGQDFPTAASYCKASYPTKEKLYWYDSFPHPTDPSLASTHPHHKHIPPNIKRHRIPAPDLSFTAPNLPFLIQEIEQEVLANRTDIE